MSSKKQRRAVAAAEPDAGDAIVWEGGPDPFLDSFCLRGKGLLDGCASLDAMAARLAALAAALQGRAAEGFVLANGPVSG